MEIPTLQTDRLLLRPFSAADVDAYAELNANQEVMRYIDKVQDREAAFRSLCANIGHWHVRGYGPWAVEDRATGRLIGRAGVLAWEGKPGPEVGYALHPSVWGKGSGPEAVARSASTSSCFFLGSFRCSSQKNRNRGPFERWNRAESRPVDVGSRHRRGSRSS